VKLGGAAQLGKIAATVNLSPSQAHRYLTSLITAGMVRQSLRSGQYEMADGALRLGLAALGRVDMFSALEEPVLRYVRETGRTAAVSMWGPYGATVVRWYPGTPPVMTTITIGSILSSIRTATGQCFLAFLNTSETEAVVAKEIAEDRSGAPVDLEKLIATVRARGYAHGTVIPGLRAQAAPVLDFQGRSMAVVASLATDYFDRRQDDAALRVLLSTCRDASTTLGATWPY
jgi:DNA-binding IclR family transcriptional regulator